MSYARDLINQFAGKGLLLDTNVLLVYVIGMYDLKIIEDEKFKDVLAYTLEDFEMLYNLVCFFTKAATTPHVLSEVSNFLGHLHEEQRFGCRRSLSKTLKDFLEIQSDSAELMQHERFQYLGLADIALATVAKEYLIVTADLKLVSHLSQMGCDALNLNHLRQERWMLEAGV